MPDARPDVPPDRWTLTPEGRAAAQALVAQLPARARVLSSDETKALETAHELEPGKLIVDARVRETRRPFVWAGDSGERARAYVGGVRHEGWEAHEDVIARFDAAIRDHRPDVVVTHGQALTLWLAHIGAVEDPVAFWGELVFPHVVRV
jgi:2,3-bisphosphoglycerate-dependent phosphoglycerate mutase